ncbi:hypothetical protein Drorol1_Dr00025248 [Drosera rotundifolia]
MWATTFPRIRRKFFELFFYTHYLYILFVFFFILHVGIAYACIMLPGFYLFMIDRFLRYLQSRSRVRIVSARVLPCEAMELNFSKSAVWFKATASDVPISPILGKNGWLWLAGIIAVSFVAFLLFMGFLTRFYIYPIDHNTNRIFSSSTRSVLNILLICICISGTSSLAVNWTKKRNTTATTQIMNMEGMSARTTPESWASNGDRELESLPHQSLVQATNILHGERPDLKRLLFDCKGSSIGVLVCGPKRMRHKVATICSSGLAKNLHFEAFSFSWWSVHYGYIKSVCNGSHPRDGSYPL